MLILIILMPNLSDIPNFHNIGYIQDSYRVSVKKQEKVPKKTGHGIQKKPRIL